MCRIFGFRSVISSQVHHSLVSADNAIAQQSHEHPDGWGVAYYAAGAPHIIKSNTTAIQDNLFKKVSGVVTSETVVAHIRKATIGDNNILNTHPFQYGQWVFVHNGNIKNFALHENELRQLISPRLKPFLLGHTDSEILFYLMLTHFETMGPLENCQLSLADMAEAAKQVIDSITRRVGPWHKDENGPPSETYLSFLITNGRYMLAFQGGKGLFYSTYKVRCSERESCPKFSNACENSPTNGQVNHFLISSEPLSGENVWLKMAPGEMIGVNKDMEFALLN